MQINMMVSGNAYGVVTVEGKNVNVTRMNASSSLGNGNVTFGENVLDATLYNENAEALTEQYNQFKTQFMTTLNRISEV